MLGRIIDYVIDLICDTFTSIPQVYDKLQVFLHNSLRHNVDNQFGLFFSILLVLLLIVVGVINLGTQNMYGIYISIVWLAMIIGGVMYFIEYQSKSFDARIEEETPNFPLANIFASAMIALWILTIFTVIAYISSIPIMFMMNL